MKFAAKYETLKALIREEVEVFAVRKRTSGEELIAYIFECAEAPQDQPTTQWILSNFAAIAPDAPGTALDLGKYDVPNFAYVIMSLPERDVLNEWVHQYQQKVASGPVTDFSALAVDANPTEQPASAQIMVPDTVQEPSSGMSSPLSSGHAFPGASTGPEKVPDEALFEEFGSQKPREPGEFTRQFFAEIVPKPEDARVDSAAASRDKDGVTNPFETRSVSAPMGATPSSVSGASPDVMHTRPSPDSPSVFSSTLFGQALGVAASASATQFPDSEPARISTGEFTSVFQAPSNEPVRVSQVDHPPIGPKMESGEFTRIFGSSPGALEESNSRPSTVDHSSTAPHASSTEIFDQYGANREHKIDTSYTFEPKPSSQAIDESASTQIFEEPKPFSAPTPPPTLPGLSSSDAFPNPSHLDAGAGGATIVFRPNAEVPNEAGSGSAGGPSEYTMFMSREALGPSALQSGDSIPPPSASPGGGGASAAAAFASPFITPPAVPSYQPPSPQIPAYGVAPATPASSMPGMPAIAPPAIAAPAMPSPAAPPAPSPTSYWPLIIAVNVLVLVAVLLILYFVLKHH